MSTATASSSPNLSLELLHDLLSKWRDTQSVADLHLPTAASAAVASDGYAPVVPPLSEREALLHERTTVKASFLHTTDIGSLLDSIWALISMVGMRDAKQMIARFIALMLVTEGKTERHMINFVVSGPPGTGKSTVGRIIAHIIGTMRVLRCPTEKELADMASRAPSLGRSHGGNGNGVSPVAHQTILNQRLMTMWMEYLTSVLQRVQSTEQNQALINMLQLLRYSRDSLSTVYTNMLQEQLLPHLRRHMFIHGAPPEPDRVISPGSASTGEDLHTPDASPWHAFCNPNLPCKYETMARQVDGAINAHTSMERMIHAAMQNQEVALASATQPIFANGGMGAMGGVGGPLGAPQPPTAPSAPPGGQPERAVPGDSIDLLGRGNLIGGYQGQTPILTLTEYRRRLGGVALIDEAYTMVKGEEDMYGQEWLTTTLAFLTENPDSFALGLLGYRNLIQANLMDNNPGLARRFPWWFDIQPYKATELAQIFRKQLQDFGGWTVHDSVKLEDFFERHMEHFTDNGGATEELMFMCKLQYSERAWRATLGNAHVDPSRQSTPLRMSRQMSSSSAPAAIDRVITQSVLSEALIEFIDKRRRAGRDSNRDISKQMMYV